MSSLIRLFIPPIFYKVREHIRFKHRPEYQEQLPIRDRVSDRMIVLGNGPSLTQSLDLYFDEITDAECMTVNYFAKSDWFERLRPSVYVLMDPVFFSFPSSVEQTVLSLYDDLINKTTWDLTVVMPNMARHSLAPKRLSENQHITTMFLGGNYSVPNGLTKYEAWGRNLLVPPGQTVLNTCVYLSVYWGYPETFLIGADTSFLADLRIDQKTNELYSIDSHFYSHNLYLDNVYDQQGRKSVGTTLHEELKSIATALESYWDMKRFADWKGVKVYNASEFSWIDAYERRKLR